MGRLPQTLDGMGRLSVVRPGRPNCRTAVLGPDGGPYSVRHFSLGQGGWTAGDGGVSWLVVLEGIWSRQGEASDITSSISDLQVVEQNVLLAE